jgi:hypothetical protein
MIFGMPPFSNGLAPFTFEVKRGGIQKHKVQIGEKIRPVAISSG